MDPDERFEDFALPAEGVANERAARPSRNLHAARSELVRKDPILRRAALVTHIEAALHAVRSDDEAMARIHLGAAQKVLEER